MQDEWNKILIDLLLGKAGSGTDAFALSVVIGYKLNSLIT